MENRYLKLDIRDRVATLTLNRAPGNLVAIDVAEEINAALLSLRGQEAVEVVVLRGAGGTFSEGLDLRDHLKDRVHRLVSVYLRIFETLRMLELISVAAVEGRAWGAGFELALGCNLVVAARDASFAFTEIRVGLIPPFAAVVLPRVVPRRRAMEWILTGNEVSAEELHLHGLVNRLLPPQTFEAGLTTFVGEITRHSGPVLQLAKRAQFEGYYAPFEQALYKVQNVYLTELATLEDSQEGLRAALDGREPQWRNR